MTLNKYQEIMNRVKVSDDMRARILQNIENNMDGSGASNIATFSPVPKKKKNNIRTFVSIASAAAALALVAVGSFAVYRTMNVPKASMDATYDMAEEAQVASADIQVDDASVLSTYVTSNSLSRVSGINMNDSQELLDEADNSSYALLDGNAAQIQYEFDGEIITIRKQMDESAAAQTDVEEVDDATQTTPGGTSVAAKGGEKDSAESDNKVDAQFANNDEQEAETETEVAEATEETVSENAVTVGQTDKYTSSKTIVVNGFEVTIYGDGQNYYYATWSRAEYNLDFEATTGRNEEDFKDLLSKVVGVTG